MNRILAFGQCILLNPDDLRAKRCSRGAGQVAVIFVLAAALLQSGTLYAQPQVGDYVWEGFANGENGNPYSPYWFFNSTQVPTNWAIWSNSAAYPNDLYNYGVLSPLPSGVTSPPNNERVFIGAPPASGRSYPPGLNGSVSSLDITVADGATLSFASQLYTSPGSINGGSLTTQGNGQIYVPAWANGYLSGNINSNASFTFDANGAQANLYISGSTTLNGQTTTVAVANTSANSILGTSPSDILSIPAGSQLSLTGFGNMNVQGLGIVNQGTIDAQGASTVVSTSSFSNQGLFSVPNGGRVTLASAISNSGGTIDVKDGGVLYFPSQLYYAPGTISGGTLTTEGTGQVYIPAWGNGYINGAINSNATITFDANGAGANLYVAGATSLSGHTTLVTTNTFANQFGGASGTIGGGSDTLTILAGSQLSLAGTGRMLINGLAITNHGTIDASDNNIRLNNSVVTNNGLLSAHDGGYLALGGTTISNTNGIIQPLSGSTFNFVEGTLTNLSGGVLSGGSYDLQGTLIVNQNVNTNAASITLDGPSSQFLNQSSDALASLGANSAVGQFSVIDGRLFHTNGAAGTFTNQGDVTIGPGSQFDVSHYTQSGGHTIVNGTLSAPLVDLQGGIFSGSGTLTGTLSNTAGILGPGSSPGLLHLGGGYTQGAAGSLNLEIAGLLPGTQFDQLWIGGNASLAGDINFIFLNGYLPHIGDTFDLLHIGGTFDASSAHLLALNVPSAFLYDTAFNNGVYSLTVTAVPEPSTVVLGIISLAVLTCVWLRRTRPKQS